MYWNLKQTLSYNKLLNFVVGNRGAGKSYGCKKWCMEDYIKNGKQFMWVRRFASEFEEFKETFFADIKHEFPDYEWSVISVGNTFRFKCNDKVIGFGMPLSVSLKKKSTPYPNVDKIIFDEFIIEKGSSYYLKNEVEIFLDLMETIIRTREDFRTVFFIANAITFTNPYFLYFNLSKPMNKKQIITKDDILLQFVANKEFIEKKKQSRFGKLIKDTAYAKYSIENEFHRDNNDFVTKHPEKMKYYFTLKAEGQNYGVWISYDEGIMFVSRKFDPSCKIIYTTILENHKPNTMLLKGASKSVVFKTFINSFKLGLVFFDSVKTKNIVVETIKNTL